MKLRKIKFGDALFLVLLALLLIPQTRTPIQVALNQLKVAVWSPGVETEEGMEKVPPFAYKVRDLQGNSVSVGVGQGTITFVSYWATWCPPCIAELPSIQELHADYGQAVQFLLLTQEEEGTVRGFLNRKGWELPVYLPQMAPPEALQENSIPTNFLIDGQGNILIKETGAANWNSDSVRQLLDGLLNRR
jgi:thiol-disulfide isomerase/thioredoxin